jgi:hypothetical protein
MGNVPWRKFIFLLVQLFLILKLYSWWQDKTGLGLGPFLIVAFIVFWTGLVIMSKLELAQSASRFIHYKVLSKFQFTNDWFGFLVVICACLGFFLSQALVGSTVMTYLLVLVGVVLAIYFSRQKVDKMTLLAFLCTAFVFGIGLGSKYSSNLLIIILFIVTEVILYFTTEIGG